MPVFIDTNLWACRLDQREPVKSKPIASWLEEVTQNHEVVRTDSILVLDAHQLAINKHLSWFDALIVEAAIRNRCDVFFSEDLSHGSQIAGMTVCNPLQ